MDGTGDGRGNGSGDVGAGTVARLAKKLRYFVPMIPHTFLFFALLAAAGLAVAMELPSHAGTVPFDHSRHIVHEKGNCAVCHHTSTGTEVRETCRQCHRPSARSVPDSRTAFHGSCIGCHEKLRRNGQAAGPTKRCSGCHQQAAVKP